MTLDEVISYNRLFADMETKSGDLEVAEYYRDTAKCLEELKELREQISEYKRLLKVAVEDFSYCDGFYGLCYYNIGCGVCADCNNTPCNKFQWRYADEALKLLNDEK